MKTLKQKSFLVSQQLQFHMITTQKEVILQDIIHKQKWISLDFFRIIQLLLLGKIITIKQYVRNGNSAGKETKKGTWKCKTNNAGVDVVMTDTKPVSQPQKSVAKVVAKSTPNTKRKFYWCCLSI